MSTLAAGRVVSVRTGRILPHERPEWDEVRSDWRTAYWKQARDGAVEVGALGLDGDEQADTLHHGGPEMAVLMYAGEHYGHWRTHGGLEAMGPGGFGENLTLSGLLESTVCVGDVLAVGEAELQVASPRGPCMDISRRWNAAWLLERVVAERRTGWYLRVRRAGAVQAGDEVRIVERPHPGWTVDRLLRLRYLKPHVPHELAEAAQLAAFADHWRTQLARLAGHAGHA